MINTYVIDVERVLEHIYAFCAVDTFTCRERRPEILGRDHAPALRHLVYACAVELVGGLTPPVVASSVDEIKAKNMITVEMDIPEDMPRDNIRPSLETALASMVMARAWGGADPVLASVYAEMAATASRTLRNIFVSVGRIEPAA